MLQIVNATKFEWARLCNSLLTRETVLPRYYYSVHYHLSICDFPQHNNIKLILRAILISTVRTELLVYK